MDYKRIELAAKEAMYKAQMSAGTDDIQRDIAKAIAAAIAEYDKQKSE